MPLKVALKNKLLMMMTKMVVDTTERLEPINRVCREDKCKHRPFYICLQARIGTDSEGQSTVQNMD